MAEEFSQVLASIERINEDSFSVVVPPDWLQGRTVFGGMQMALGARAMRAALPVTAATLPPGRSRTDLQFTDFFNWCYLFKEIHQIGVVVH